MLEKIATKLELRVIEIQKVVNLLLIHNQVGNNDLVRQTGLPKTTLQKILIELKDYLEPSSQFCQLKTEARQTLLDLVPEIDLTKQKAKIIATLSHYQKDRPSPDRNLDQFTATISTSARRAILMAKNGDIDGRSIAVLGDDDLNSVVFALAGTPKSITVFEKDPRILTLVGQISQDLGLNINLVEFDLLESIPSQYHHQYDTIFSDPPYTPSGISLFLNRGIELMKDQALSRFYLCYGNSDRARERELARSKNYLRQKSY